MHPESGTSFGIGIAGNERLVVQVIPVSVQLPLTRWTSWKRPVAPGSLDTGQG